MALARERPEAGGVAAAKPGALPGPRPRPPAPRPAAQVDMLFLGLNLVLVAFFAMLVALSQREEERSRQVLASLHATFQTQRPDALALPFDDGPLAPPAAGGLVRLEGALRALPPLTAELDPEVDGRLELRLPAELWFAAGTSAPRRERRVLLGRIAAVLADAEDGPITAELTLAVPDLAAPAGHGLALARVGALARALVDLGAPAARVVVGLEEGRAADLRLVFQLAAEEAWHAP